jgi:hypothetical protein
MSFFLYKNIYCKCFLRYLLNNLINYFIEFCIKNQLDNKFTK